MFLPPIENKQLEQVAWELLEAAFKNDMGAFVNAMPRFRMALADVPASSAKKAEMMASYSKLEAELFAEILRGVRLRALAKARL